ncbi:methyltransferase family protein [Ruminobacter sp.]|uniref:methyltransferase family protein n=1 Tax=Ruminobacter sp. TaxID=2774296 RepID=UPI00386516D8
MTVSAKKSFILRILPPPAVFSLFAILHVIFGFSEDMTIPVPLGLISLILLAAGGVLAATSLYLFTAEGISPLPWKTNDTVLFTGGVYRLSRNPMYLSLMLGLAGIGITFCPLLLLMTLPMLFHFLSLVTEREETVNGIIFGEKFSEYCSRTRRWL